MPRHSSLCLPGGLYPSVLRLLQLLTRRGTHTAALLALSGPVYARSGVKVNLGGGRRKGGVSRRQYRVGVPTDNEKSRRILTRERTEMPPLCIRSVHIRCMGRGCVMSGDSPCSVCFLQKKGRTDYRMPKRGVCCVHSPPPVKELKCVTLDYYFMDATDNLNTYLSTHRFRTWIAWRVTFMVRYSSSADHT